MRGFKLDPLTWDLSLDDAGRLEEVDGQEATAQEVTTRLLFFRGECRKDLREGIPYYQEILRKGVDPARVRAIVRAAIRSVPAVEDVPVVEFSLDRTTREATIRWEARDKTGATIRSEDYGPLVLP